jgi:hypothetical protein
LFGNRNLSSVALVGLHALRLLPLERTVDVRDRLPNVVLLGYSFLHQLAGMKHSAMVPSAKRVADFIQGCLGKFAGQIHGDLSWKSDAGRATLARHIGKTHVEMFGYATLNLFDGDRLPAFFLEDVL